VYVDDGPVRLEMFEAWSSLLSKVGSTTITSHAYTLDNEGNRTAQQEFVSGITTGTSDTFGYSYDGLNRLTAVTTTNAESFVLVP